MEKLAKQEAGPSLADKIELLVNDTFTSLAEGLEEILDIPVSLQKAKAIACFCKPRVINEDGYIYFIRCLKGATDLVKIGYAKDVMARFDTLKYMSPVRLALVAFIPGTMKDERELHKKFKHLRKHGEWFTRDLDLIEYIERIKNNAQNI